MTNFTDKDLITLAPIRQSSLVSWISIKFPLYHFSGMASYIERHSQILPDVLAQLLTALVFTPKMAPIRTINYMVTSCLINLLWKSVSQGFSMNTEVCLYPSHPRFEDILGTTRN